VTNPIAKKHGGARTWRRAGRRRPDAGYTAVEILMSMAVLAVGVIGIIATEKVTLASNTHAKNMAIATRIGEAWLGVLEAEAAIWDRERGLTNTTWLEEGAGQTDWFRPTPDDTVLDFGPAFDALGNPVALVDQATNARFCVDLRLSPLTGVTASAGMVRAEVRVFWIRDRVLLSGAAVAPAHACSFAAAAMTADAQSSMFHFIFLSTAVRQAGT
jgi:hypothetical protein